MDQMRSIAHTFAPTPQDGLAFSAMPDAPVQTLTKRHVRRQRSQVVVRWARGRARRASATPATLHPSCSH
jgi:hypothetical protein